MSDETGVLIAIPHIGELRAELVNNLLQIVTSNTKYKIKVALLWGRPIAKNRNQIIQTFLKTDLDYLLQIDSDVVPPLNILDMIDHNVDIVSGDIYTRNGEGKFRLALKDSGGGNYHTKPNLKAGLNRVDATGTGCFLTSRKVIEELKEFRGDREDFDFCERARQAGYAVWYDTTKRCYHYTIMPL